MILRFTVNLDVSFTNNTAELPARSVKVQQRTSGDSWRTLQGLIDFAVVQSYLSTATKWGINTPRREDPTVHHRCLAPTCPHPRQHPRHILGRDRPRCLVLRSQRLWQRLALSLLDLIP